MDTPKVLSCCKTWLYSVLFHLHPNKFLIQFSTKTNRIKESLTFCYEWFNEDLI